MTAAADAIILDRLRRYADRALKVRQLTALLAADADLAVAATLALLGRAGAGDEGAPRRRELVVLREFRHWVDEQQRALDEWQKRVDNKVRTAIGGISPFSGLHKDVRALSDRIAELEAKLQAMADSEGRE